MKKKDMVLVKFQFYAWSNSTYKSGSAPRGKQPYLKIPLLLIFRLMFPKPEESYKIFPINNFLDLFFLDSTHHQYPCATIAFGLSHEQDCPGRPDHLSSVALLTSCQASPVAAWRQATVEAAHLPHPPTDKDHKCDGHRPHSHHCHSDPHTLCRPHLALLSCLLLCQEPARQAGPRKAAAAEHRRDGCRGALCRPLRPLHQVPPPL